MFSGYESVAMLNYLAIPDAQGKPAESLETSL